MKLPIKKHDFKNLVINNQNHFLANVLLKLISQSI